MRHANMSKTDSHNRIVTEAARLMREKGSAHVSVADVMKASGLTHGGFYAHFDSKNALAAAAIGKGFREKIDVLTADNPHALQDYVASFLSDGHLENLGAGCPVAAFAPDATKSDALYQVAVSDGMTQLLQSISRGLGAHDSVDDQAIRLLATMVGGIIMARAAAEPVLREKIMTAIRQAPSVLETGLQGA